MNEIRVWKIVPLRMVTTSEQERDKWIAAGHEVVEFVSIDRITQLEIELAAALASQAQQEIEITDSQLDELENLEKSRSMYSVNEYRNQVRSIFSMQSQAQQTEQEPYAYDVPTTDGTELAYAIYFTKYNNPLPEGAIPLYATTTSTRGRVRMSKKLRVSTSPLSNTIFAGTILKDGRTWSASKQDVTTDALVAVAYHVLAFGKPVLITNDGKPEFEITVKKFSAPEGDNP